MESHASRFAQVMTLGIAALMFVSAGCSGGKSSPSPATTQAASGQLSASPASIAFGSVALNTTTTQHVQLSNPGASSVTVSSATINGPGFSVTGLSVPQTLASGQSLTFSVIFDPSSPGSAAGSVQITATDATSPLTIGLTGTGATAGPTSPSSHSVALSWVPSTSTVIGYNVYRANQSGGPYAVTNSSLVADTTFSDSSVLAGQTYWYVVTSVVAGGIESAFSNEAMAVIPTP